MRALVTGGSGFVGRHLVDALVARGDEVVVWDEVDPVRRDVMWTRRFVRTDVVYHFAANASVRNTAGAPVHDWRANVLLTSRLLEEMRGRHKYRIVFASSSAVYGNTTVLPTPEDAPMPVQTSLYGASKLAAEALLQGYAETYGFNVTILRFVPMLGEGYHRGHVFDFYQKLRTDPRRIEILGDGQQRKAYVYVKDAVQAALLAGEGVYNVGGAQLVSVDESLDVICDELGVRPERTYTGSSWAGDKRYTWLDTTRIERLGWQTIVTPHEAIRRTVRSFSE